MLEGKECNPLVIQSLSSQAYFERWISDPQQGRAAQPHDGGRLASSHCLTLALGSGTDGTDASSGRPGAGGDHVAEVGVFRGGGSVDVLYSACMQVPAPPSLALCAPTVSPHCRSHPFCLLLQRLPHFAHNVSGLVELRMRWPAAWPPAPCPRQARARARQRRGFAHTHSRARGTTQGQPPRTMLPGGASALVSCAKGMQA